MADPLHYQFLLDCIDKPNGRRLWLEFKMKLRWVDLCTADLSGCNLRNYDFADVNLSTALLNGANLEGADLADANLALADLSGAHMRNVCADRANMAGANLEGADLSDARLDATALRGARLGKARLAGADLNNADLAEADLRDAYCRYARLTAAKLGRARVAGADLTGCLLDADAGQYLVDFDQAQRGERQFKPLRARTLVAAGAGTTTAPALDPETEQIRARKKERARARAEAEAAATQTAMPGVSARPGPPGGVERRRPNQPDHTDEMTEPGVPHFRAQQCDLTTVEGCCALLEVTTNAPVEEVVKAFRRKAKLFHPDMVRHLSPRLQELAADEFQRLHLAYETLTRRTTRSLTGVRWADGVPHRATPYEHTCEEYERLARVNPAHTGILYNLGWKYFEEGRYTEAREMFERVLTIDANDEDALFNLMIVRLYLEVQLPLLEKR